MANPAAKHPTEPVHTVRSAKTGQFMTVRGAGALKGQLALKKGVDLTKPIASQALRDVKQPGASKR